MTTKDKPQTGWMIKSKSGNYFGRRCNTAEDCIKEYVEESFPYDFMQWKDHLKQGDRAVEVVIQEVQRKGRE